MKLIFLVALLFQINGYAQSLSPERVARIKNATVQLTIEGTTFTGSGFFIDNKGKLLTCWHVIAPALLYDTAQRVPVQNRIIAQLNDGRKIEYGLQTVFVTDTTVNTIAVGYDFAVLLPKTNITTPFLKLGSYSNSREGDEIYTCGYPLSIPNPFVSRGIISTKYTDTANSVSRPTGTLYRMPRNQALLDITLNSGNSGGPIVRTGKTIDDDEVIGIADFIITPMWPYYESLNTMLESSINSGASAQLAGVDPVRLFYLFAKVLGSSSVGISGCVSVDHIKTSLGLR